MDEKRRQLLTGISLAGAGILLNACRGTSNPSGSATNEEKTESAPGEHEPVDVTATEDLMREHGILRRALLVYQESATRLRQDPASVPRYGEGGGAIASIAGVAGTGRGGAGHV